MLTHHDEGDVAVITLNRPDRRNALNVELCDMLGETIHAKVARGARAIVITGEGSAFCSGADLDAVYGDAFLTSLYGMFAKIRSAPMPVIAAVNGPAIGAGTQLALACDLRMVDDRAVFAVPTARNGLVVDPWTIRRLTELAGGGPARRLLLGAGQLDRDEALQCGLADHAGPISDAIEWASEIATFAPMSLAYSKKVLNNPSLPEDDEDLRAEFLACFASEDVAEGRKARSEKRTPRFTGR
ncbi:enoyl-CoA hydratase [Epidermidibacterium keratini]|uniref:Enoyl-CoA hydratase n=1 Tax=Epidermidibacterium keratini TaxID=1891644 RepID=A0A7L4YQK5_9ACTN|nr:enoyl-CoA hydratase [Epidermidibacterium keratini]QHC00837.1 enoyl-CoA hydratase [Epidermidibacterium keratini]